MSAMTMAPTLRVTGRRARSGAAIPTTADRRSAAPGRMTRDATPGTTHRASRRGDHPMPTAPATLRLTRRGRAVVWLLGAALASGVGGAALSAQADGPVAATEVRRVVVAPGETLWGIAASVASPEEDVRDVVLRLMELNELPSGGLQAGQTIVVPLG